MISGASHSQVSRPVQDVMKLSDFRVLSFDCYGTLIDWETGLLNALEPLLDRSGRGLQTHEALSVYGRLETEQEAATPDLPYSRLLSVTLTRFADELGVSLIPGEAERFGASVPKWPAFSDSANALRYLKRHFKLVILSNVDRDSFWGSSARLGIEFDAVYTAQDIGSYKPDLRNFEYMLARLESDHHVRPDDVLHLAQSLFHDHVPANKIGLASAWIDRRHGKSGWGAVPAPECDVKYDFRFPTLADAVEAHRAELGASAQ